jgi:hypothetical protein
LSSTTPSLAAQRGRQDLLHIREKRRVIHGPIEDSRGGEPVEAEAGHDAASANGGTACGRAAASRAGFGVFSSNSVISAGHSHADSISLRHRHVETKA